MLLLDYWFFVFAFHLFSGGLTQKMWFPEPQKAKIMLWIIDVQYIFVFRIDHRIICKIKVVLPKHAPCHGTLSYIFWNAQNSGPPNSNNQSFNIQTIVWFCSNFEFIFEHDVSIPLSSRKSWISITMQLMSQMFMILMTKCCWRC